VGGEGELSLRVRLLFQSTTRECIEFLRDNTPDSADPDITNRGAISYQLWLDEGGRTPTTMALGATPGPCPEPPMGAGADAEVDAGFDAGPTPVPADDGGCGCSAPSSGPLGSVPFFGGILPFVALLSSLVISRRRSRP